MQAQIRINSLEKQFPRFKLGPINLTFDQSQVIGILGPNGSGKTTFFELVTGNLFANQGEVSLNGEAVTPEKPLLKRRIGYLPQHLKFPNWVSGIDILTYCIYLHLGHFDPQLLSEQLKAWDCDSFKHRPLAACSHGMKKRIALAACTFHNPQVLVLDEPFSGLDILHMKNLMQLIETRKTAKQLTILSTHITPYVAQLCDQVFIIQNGTMIEISAWNEKSTDAKQKAIETYFAKLQ